CNENINSSNGLPAKPAQWAGSPPLATPGTCEQVTQFAHIATFAVFAHCRCVRFDKGAFARRPAEDDMIDRKRAERLQVMLTDDELRILDDWRFRARMPSRAAAVRELLKRGLAAE